MRKLTLAGILPALMLCATGCGEREMPTAAIPKKTLEAAPASPGTNDALATKVAAADSATSSEAKPADVTAADAKPAAHGNSVAAAEITPAAAGDTVPMETLEEPGIEAGELGIGDAAPPIAISKWVKGEPVTAFNPEKVHVVEFWATWCGPCLASMPHIAGLQVEYGDKVTFIGVSDEDDATVSGFMGETPRGSDKTWSEVLTYTIALDDQAKTNAAYMQAAGQNGIPCAFIIGRNGKVEWIGHPIQIDEPLQQIVDGNWDSEKARVDYLASREAVKAKREFGPRVGAAVNAGDFKTAADLLAQLIERCPNDKQFPIIRFEFLLRGGMMDEVNKAAGAMIETAKDDAMQLNQIGWMMATMTEEPGVDLNVAHAAAQRAVELTEEKNASILDTLARVTFKQGKVAEAVALQKKAVELSPDEKQIQDSLVEFETALTAAGTSAAEATPATDEKPADPATPPGK